MSKVQRFFIVEYRKIYNNDQIKEIKMTEDFILKNTATPNLTIEFFARCRLIKNESKCIHCNRRMTLITTKKSTYGFIWRCSLGCKKTQSIRYDSFFSECKIEIKKMLRMLYKIVMGTKQVYISFDLSISEKSVSKYMQKLRDKCIEDFSNGDNMIGGLDENGIPIVVEIDKSLFFKNKYNRGRSRGGTWYVAGVERNSKNAFIVPVVDRSAETMFQLINNHVRPGTICITDE
ncbi:hypothetical protein DMUE_1702 [Dictyocoela muelleri]|nr:hypothetical protein DMUE_1702 [Dictyocoela muelleri]